MSYLAYPDDDTPGLVFGGKAKALRALAAARLPIPPWFVVLPNALLAALDDHQRQQFQNSDAHTDVASILHALRMDAAVEAAIAAAVAQLAPAGELLAVRSSASDEDGTEHSFAGQLESYLFVTPADVADRVIKVWRSGFSDRILAYRREHGLAALPPIPAVLVQRMLQPEAAGVAFGADPVSGRRDVAVVGAVYGVGSGLVSGDCDADTWHVDRSGEIVKYDIANKRWAHERDPTAPEGVRRVALPAVHAQHPALTDAQVKAVAELTRAAGRHFQLPQDIEWAIADEKLYLLQSRPITSLVGLPDPTGVHAIWDNSNIAESYRGVTTPLTFSFARRAYEFVYREFCRMMQVPHAVVAAHDDTFRRMLGLIRGRVYYNLLNWYRVLALLPGFRVNRQFMEQMMGVKESLPDDVLADLAHTSLLARITDLLRLIRTLFGLVVNHLLLPRKIRHFYRRLEAALAEPSPRLADQRPDELMAYYRALERQLLTRWDAPLINDFFAMIFFGVARKLCQSWCGDSAGTLQNDLISGEGGMISAEPAQRIRALALIAAAHSELARELRDGTVAAMHTAIAKVPAFQEAYTAYLAKFGDRCLEELKLESPTLHDDPISLLRTVGQLASRALPVPTPASVDGGMRRAAEARVRAALRRRPLRSRLFWWVLGHARARVRDRENLRFERTRVFGRVRRIFVEIGQQFYARRLLASARDIFYLELEEIAAYIEGTASSTDIAALAAIRQKEFAGFHAGAPPADRFETRGLVYHAHNYRAARADAPAPSGDHMQGTACCPGIVRGRARVITDPRNATLAQGDVLVAERTDPGWIMLFPAAAGVLVEHGSLLSHSAIVARELGLPAVVGLEGVTRWIKDGDWIEFDGGTGIVRRIDEIADIAQSG